MAAEHQGRRRRPTRDATRVSRVNSLVELLNEDLAREYQAIIAYVDYSQMLKGAAYMSIAKELEVHAGEELQHALTIAKQIDYLGGMPTIMPEPVKISEKAEEMLRFDLDNENDTVAAYRERVSQCEALGEFALAEEIREILRRSRSIRSIWRRRWARTCPTSDVCHGGREVGPAGCQRCSRLASVWVYNATVCW